MNILTKEIQEILKDIKVIKEMTFDYVTILFAVKNKFMAIVFTILLISCINIGRLLYILILK